MEYTFEVAQSRKTQVRREDLWLASVWIALGAATFATSNVDGLLNWLGPVFVGAAVLVRHRTGNAAYYVLAFAAITYRVIDYMLISFWPPLFVWLLVITYMQRSKRQQRSW